MFIGKIQIVTLNSVAKSIGMLLALCGLLLIESAGAQNVTLNWNAPTTNSDGTPLTDLAGFKVYRSLSPGNYIAATVYSVNAPTNSMATIGHVFNTTYFYRVTAVDFSGN